MPVDGGEPLGALVLHAGGGLPGAASGWWVPLLVMGLGGGGYLVGVHRYRARRLRSWSAWRTAGWLSGTALVALALSPAVTAPGQDLRTHMVQHLLLGMLAPVGLVLGAPVTLLLGAAGVRVQRAVAKVLRTRGLHVVTHPAAAAVLDVGAMFLLYLTPVYALSAREDPVHHLLHVHFLVAGYLFAWAIAGPDPAPRRPGTATRVVVLVLAGGAHGYLSKLLYAGAGELPPGGGHTAAEVESAAQWMYYGGDVASLALATALFAGWYRRRTPRATRRRARVTAREAARSARTAS